jgi:hypothetical protein
VTDPSELGNAFGPSAAGLAGRLARRSSTPAAPAIPVPQRHPEPPSPAPTPAPQRAVEAPAPEPPEPERRPAKKASRPATKRTPAPRPAPTPAVPVDVPTSTSTVQVSVYLLPAALQAVRREVRRTKRTNADMAFTAIDATHRDLPELVARRRIIPREEGSLFPSRVRHRATGDESRRILWSMQATPDELQVIDQLVDDTGAASRSELISVAVEAHLL